MLKEFLESYNEGTTVTERTTRMRGTVELALRPHTEDLASVVFVDLILQRGASSKGTASAALDWVCELADKFQIILFLLPVPSDSIFLSVWYTKRRFIPVAHNYMRRDPND